MLGLCCCMWVSSSCSEWGGYSLVFMSGLLTMVAFPRWFSGKESTCQCRRPWRLRFVPWVGKIPWRRKWQPTPVFLPGESHGQRSLAGYSLWSCRVRYDWATNTHTLVADHGVLGAQASVVVAHGLSCIWNLPRPGFEPVSPALVGKFLTTGPAGKSQTSYIFLNVYKCKKKIMLNKLLKVYIKLVGGCFLALLCWAVGRLVPNWLKGIRLSVLWSVGLWGLTVRCEQIGQIGALYLAILFHLIKHILYLRSVDRGSCFYIPHKLQ